MERDEIPKAQSLEYRRVAPGSLDAYRRFAIFGLRTVGSFLIVFTTLGVLTVALQWFQFGHVFRTGQLIATAAYGVLGVLMIAYAPRVGRTLGAGLD